MNTDGLSDSAKAVGLALFPTMAAFVIFGAGGRLPTDECRSALGELVEKGFVSAEELKSGGVFYRPNASFGHLAEWARERADTRVEIWRRKGDGNAPCSAPSAEAGTEPVGTDLTSVLGGDRFS